MPRIPLRRYGFGLEIQPDDRHLADAGEIERLGFGTLWIRGGQLDRLERLTDVLAATDTAIVAPAIIAPDVFPPDAVVNLFEVAESMAPDRLIVGVGTPHGRGAIEELCAYADRLDAVPRERRLLAAFGPRALGVARDRFAGALPNQFTPEHVTWARRLLGADATLSVGAYVVLDEHAASARATARQTLGFLTTLPAYRRSAARQGFSPEDIDGLSDHLVDTLVAWGSPSDAVAHADRLLDAGADHVQLTVLGSGAQPTGAAAARLLAAEFS